MQEYDLSPDELIAKAFRMIQSSHPGYYPHTKKDWIAAMQKVYENDGKVFAGYLQDKYRHLYEQGIWIFDDGPELWLRLGCNAALDFLSFLMDASARL